MNAAQKARLAMRRGEWTGPTKHRVPGFVKCNLVVVNQAHAFDFLLFCQRNPKPCPVVEVTDPGDPEPKFSAPGADLRTDLPRYAVYRNGVREADRIDILELWNEQSVGFLIGSGMSFDGPLERAGVPRTQTWLFETSLQTVPAGRFFGPMVVTMRLLTPPQAVIACQLTGRFVYSHGAPIHLGDPETIGVRLDSPLVGPPLESIPEGKIAVFWACGVTPQSAAQASKLDLMIAHAPAHSFVTDLQVDQYCIP